LTVVIERAYTRSMLQFFRHGALLLSLVVLVVLAVACASSGSSDPGLDGGVGGTGGTRGPLDSDFDGVPDDEDPCATTLADATQVRPGCSATDIIQDERHLVAPIDDGIKKIQSIAGMPPTILDALDEARLALGVAVRAFVDEDPCAGVAGFEMVVDLIDGAHMEMQDFLFELETSIPPYPAGAAFPDDVPAEASRYLIWTLHADSLHHVMDDAMEASSLVSQICDQKMGTMMVNGFIQSVRDDLRVVVLRSGEAIVLAPNIQIEDEEPIGEGREVSFEVTQLNDAFLATRAQIHPAQVPLFRHVTYDDCLSLRIVPRGDIAGPEPDPIDGYLHFAGHYDFEQGSSFGAENRGCPTPGDLAGQGPGGVDMKIIYSYQLLFVYTDALGQPRSRNVTFEFGDVNSALRAPVVFPPNIDPTIPGTLHMSKLKTTCFVDPNLPQLGRYDPQSGEIGPAEPQYDCSNKELLEFVSPTAFVRQPGYFCDAVYTQTVFAIEDDDTETWEQTQVDFADPKNGVPVPLTFSAIGSRIVNGAPVVGQEIRTNQPFAVYGAFSPHRTGFSGLVAAHATGTRSGLRFTYSCATPGLGRDAVEICGGGGDAFYRLPYPNGTEVHVNQGNGGTASHNVDDVQEWALDLGGSQWDPVVAARGGTVVKRVGNIVENCGGCGEGNNPPCPSSCPAYGNHVAVQHDDGEVSWYMHLVQDIAMQNDPVVMVGQRIKRGDPIGKLGNTGRSGGPHLHFQATGTFQVPDGMGGFNDNWQTVPIRYEVQGATCFVPSEGFDYISSNEPN